MKRKRINKVTTPYVGLLIVVFIIYMVFSFLNVKVHKLRYDKFLEHINKGDVKSLEITPSRSKDIYRIKGKNKKYKSNEYFVVQAPRSDVALQAILKNKDAGYKLDVKGDPSGSTTLTFIANLLPIILIMGAGYYFLTSQIKNNGGSLDFGKSKARLAGKQDVKIRFKDVAGLKEEKQEVAEIIDFLKSPEKFTKLGARIPKGLLLVGPPGTGKTLLAKAVAGEAGVPFYFISGSDFIELFVGVGASRVRDMFKEAKANAPCVIFIDEIDAIGRQRGSGLGGGHDEREQTLNQLLTEMDGFGENEGIIVMAATNRDDVLDPALLRPGRFDRKVTVDLPDVREREEIIKVHMRNKKFTDDVSTEALAKRTPGFSGATIENMLNEAAILAVRRNKKVISMSEIDEATDRVIGGPAKVSRKYTDHEKAVVAYHEAGHAVVGIKLAHADEVHKITIIPRGPAGGYTLMMPKEETYFSSKKELLETITGLFAGRASEEITFNEITTGAHNDFERATKIARAMVTEYGMSDLGPIQFEQNTGSVFLGRDYNKTRNFSDAVALEIDKEVRKILDECYNKAIKILKENKDLLKTIAEALLEHETLTKEEIDYLVEHGKMPSSQKKDDYTLDELQVEARELNIKNASKMNKEELEKAIAEKKKKQDK